MSKKSGISGTCSHVNNNIEKEDVLIIRDQMASGFHQWGSLHNDKWVEQFQSIETAATSEVGEFQNIDSATP